MQAEYRSRVRSNVMTLTRTRARLPGNQIGICSPRERQLAVAWEYCRCRRAVEGDVYERMEAGGLSVDEPVSDLKHGNFILFFAGSTAQRF
jgi:hypothetical protein